MVLQVEMKGKLMSP